MPDYSLYARVVRPEAVMEAVYGIAKSPKPLSEEEVSRFIDQGERYTKAVMNLGEQLGILHESTDVFRADSEIKKDIIKAEKDQRKTLLKSYVLDYKPFMSFISFLEKGYESETAAKNVDVLYDMGLDDSKLKSQLTNLGEWTEIIEGEKINIEVETLSKDYIEDIEEATNSKAKARLFMEKKLGQDVYAYLNDKLIQEIADGILEFRECPRNAIGEVGRAVEDFQRDIGDDYGKKGEYEKATGIGLVSQEMAREEWAMSRHTHGGNYLSGMRNPSGGHGYNPETLERWEVRPDVALDYILASLHYIRSVYKKAEEDRQVL